MIGREKKEVGVSQRVSVCGESVVVVSRCGVVSESVCVVSE